MDPSFQVTMQCQATSGDGWYKSGCVGKVLPSVFWKQDHLSPPRRKWLPWEQVPLFCLTLQENPFFTTSASHSGTPQSNQGPREAQLA